MSNSSTLDQAIQLYKAKQAEQSCQQLRALLQRDPDYVKALLWLARASSDSQESRSSAELALALQPENEIAQRAVAVVAQRAVPLGPPTELEATRLTGMTLAQARAVNWPFRGLNRPIGVLLDEGTIDRKDLGYAVDKAYDAQLKRAATTLLLQHLLRDGLQDPPPGLKVYGHRSFAARNERMALLTLGILAGLMAVALLAMVGLAGLYVYALIVGLNADPRLSGAINFGSLGLAGIMVGLYWLSERAMQTADSSRAGAAGERRASELFQATLRSPWALFRNAAWPNRPWGDVDLILTGPGGVWVFEVKAFTSRVRNRGDRWEYAGRFGWRPLSQHPGQQARRNAVAVKNYLEQHGAAPGFVQAVVLWADERETLTVDDPATPVWRLSELEHEIEALWQSEKLTPTQVEKCQAILADVIAQDEARIAAEEAKEKRPRDAR